jgi:hypothetical protein
VGSSPDYALIDGASNSMHNGSTSGGGSSVSTAIQLSSHVGAHSSTLHHVSAHHHHQAGSNVANGNGSLRAV